MFPMSEAFRPTNRDCSHAYIAAAAAGQQTPDQEGQAVPAAIALAQAELARGHQEQELAAEMAAHCQAAQSQLSAAIRQQLRTFGSYVRHNRPCDLTEPA